MSDIVTIDDLDLDPVTVQGEFVTDERGKKIQVGRSQRSARAVQNDMNVHASGTPFQSQAIGLRRNARKALSFHGREPRDRKGKCHDRADRDGFFIVWAGI